MAMTKTESLQEVRALPNQVPMGETEGDVIVIAQVLVNWDDPDDADLPVSKTERRSFNRGDDVSGQDQLVQDICAAVWTDA